MKVDPDLIGVAHLMPTAGGASFQQKQDGGDACAFSSIGAGDGLGAAMDLSVPTPFGVGLHLPLLDQAFDHCIGTVFARGACLVVCHCFPAFTTCSPSAQRVKAFRFGTELLIRMPRFAGAPADAGVRLSTAPLEVVEASPFSFVGSCPLLLAAGLLLDQQRLLKLALMPQMATTASP